MLRNTFSEPPVAPNHSCTRATELSAKRCGRLAGVCVEAGLSEVFNGHKLHYSGYIA
jgi:hypothetical protein